MAEFKAITTQEEFDTAIKERLERAERKTREEFKGWTSPDDLKKLNESHITELNQLKESHAKEMEKYAGYDEKFSEFTAKIHSLEVNGIKTRIASEKKLPLDAVEFLQGDDEQTIAESAERLMKISGTPQTFAYTRNTESEKADAKDKDLRELLAKLPGRH